jgi:hypothetical protein
MLALDGKESASCSCCFAPCETVPRTHCIGGWLGGPQSRSGHYGEEKSLLPLPGIEPRLLSCPACSVIAILTELNNLQIFIWQEKLLTRHNTMDSNKIPKTCF